MALVEPPAPIFGVVAVDDENRIAVWSRSAEGLFDYTAAEMSGRDVAVLFDGWPPANGEAVARRKRGTTFNAAIEIDKGENGYSLITVRDASRARLLAEAEALAEIGSFERDLVGGEDRWSEQLFRIFGLPPRQKPPPISEVTSLIVDEDRARFGADLESAIRDHNPLRLTYRIRRPDGELRTLRVHGSVLTDVEGRAVRIIGNVLDVTAGADAIRNREEMERQLDETRRIATLGRVAATMAHEFNNVMMGIGTFVEVLKRRKTADAVERATLGIESSIKRGRTITDEILRYTRASKPVFAHIDVAEWLADFLPEAQSITGGMAAIESERGLSIRGDASQLNQVLINLLLNARDASPPRTPITIEAKRAPANFVEIVVADRGSGIAPENLGRIFDPLFTTKPRGTGLGLAVVHQVIAAHGGSVRARSEAGIGTEFHLLLPSVEPRATTPAKARASLLLVEDDAGVAAGLSAILGSEGIEVRVVMHGRDVVHAIESAVPDVIVLDLQLPDIDGARVYDQVAERWPGLPVIFISGSLHQTDVGRYLQQPHAAFLYKPFDIDQLLNALARVLPKK
jgi:two-component system, cell cycle sensor histidine kinase and response regulator CckA